MVPLLEIGCQPFVSQLKPYTTKLQKHPLIAFRFGIVFCFIALFDNGRAKGVGNAMNDPMERTDVLVHKQLQDLLLAQRQAFETWRESVSLKINKLIIFYQTL